MQIRLRLLNNETFTIAADESSTVAQLKQKVQEKRGSAYSADGLKLIYAGKVLDKNEATVKELGMSESGFVIVMLAKKATAKTEESTSASSGPASVQSTASSQQMAEPVAQCPAAPSPVEARPETVPPDQLENLMQNLTEMGHQRNDVELALRARFYKPLFIEIVTNTSTRGTVSRPFSCLPDKIIRNILDRVDIITKIRSRRVCKEWNGILREDSMVESVIVDESIIEKQCGWMDSYYPSYHNYGGLFKKLARAGAWKSLKHLIFIGRYDVSNQEPHGDFVLVEQSAALTDLIYDMRKSVRKSLRKSVPNENVDLGGLETFEVRRAVVDLKGFGCFKNIPAVKCKLIISKSSVLLFIIGSRDEDLCYDVEFEVEGRQSFDLSGRCVKFDSLYATDPNPLLPTEIAQFVRERLDSVTAEKVAQLGELYSVLLKGRPGMMIRAEVRMLFRKICYTDEGVPVKEHDPKQPHWKQCKNYNFGELDDVHKYALLYYTRPRNCYELVKPENAEYAEDLSEF